MEVLKILRKHMEGHYLFGNEVSSEQLVDFQKSLVSAMEEYAELRLSNVVEQSEQLKAFAKYCYEEHRLFIPTWMIDGYNKSQ